MSVVEGTGQVVFLFVENMIILALFLSYYIYLGLLTIYIYIFFVRLEGDFEVMYFKPYTRSAKSCEKRLPSHIGLESTVCLN